MPLLIGLFATWRFFSRIIRSGWHKPEVRGLFTITWSVIFFGAWFYWRFEPTITNWTDAFYFTVITLTTVGYGDLSPTIALTKWFTMLYVFVGLGIIGGFIGVIGDAFIEESRKEGERTQSEGE